MSPTKNSPTESPTTRRPSAKSAPRGQQRHRPTSAQHRRVVAAVKELFRLCPLEAARWIDRMSAKADPPIELVEAQWIDQAPRGPAYVVPPPRVEDSRPADPEELMARVLKSAIEKEAKASKGKVRIETIDFDFDEAMRQTLVEGGGDIELRVRARRAGGQSLDMLLGVTLPDEHEDGTRTLGRVLHATSWHLLVYPELIGKTPAFQTVPLYLWPGTGLKDRQECCSVFKGEPDLPGFLGGLLKLQDPKQRAREQAQSRKLNRERLERQRQIDEERRAAAARRRALTGKAGITERQLRALVPEIDVENDRITMIQSYDIVRLWEEPLDALITSLPPVCMGLALFGWRPPEMSVESALERCAFTLRRALRDAPAPEMHRAALGLSAIAAAFLDPGEVTRLLRKTKLL